MRIRGQVSRGPQSFELRPKPREMRIRGLHQMNVRQVEPALDSPHHIVDTKWGCHNLAIGGQTDEARQGGPRKTDSFWTRQTVVPPATSARVNHRIGVMRVNEDVDVGQDHAALPAETWAWIAGPPRRPRLRARRRVD